MALTAVEEAQTRSLLAQEASILSLASNEPTIISKLAATKVNLSQLPSASSVADADLLLLRQGSTDKSVAGSIVKAYAGTTVPDASETVKGIVELATVAEAQAGVDTSRAVTPAGLASAQKQLQSIDYTLSANALTLKLNPTTLDFRSTTLTSGAPTKVSNASQIATTISSGSTGGTISVQQSEIYILAINNSGTMELAWCNSDGGINLDETTLINTIAEGGAGAADSSTVIYSTTARTGVAFRVVGVFRSIQTTAGSWAQSPSLVQPVGGQSLTSMQSIGYGQTWKNVLGSRALSTTYYNTTGRAIQAHVMAGNTASGAVLTLTIGGVALTNQTPGVANSYAAIDAVIPPGASYAVTMGGTPILVSWVELR